MSSCQFFWFIMSYLPCPCLHPIVDGSTWKPWMRRRGLANRPYECPAQTRRRLGGRQPLCGIGVTSRIEVT